MCVSLTAVAFSCNALRWVAVSSRGGGGEEEQEQQQWRTKHAINWIPQWAAIGTLLDLGTAVPKPRGILQLPFVVIVVVCHEVLWSLVAHEPFSFLLRSGH